MKNVLIVTGGEISKKFLKEFLSKNSFKKIIAVDRGLEVISEIGINPDLIVGDLDSVSEKTLKKFDHVKKEKFNKEKDFTDTHLALKIAIKEKNEKIILLGAIGTRIDHTLANIQVLKEALKNNVECKIINENNELFLMNKEINIKKDETYKYISIIPLEKDAKGVTLEGLKYTLRNKKILLGESIGISNEQISEFAKVKVKKGILLVVKSKD